MCDKYHYSTAECKQCNEGKKNVARGHMYSTTEGVYYFLASTALTITVTGYKLPAMEI